MNPGPLAGRVALVLGGTRGIGGAISRRLAADGARVATTYLARAADATRLADGIAADGGECVAMQADVADPVALERTFAAVTARFGRLDILVANAGIATAAPIEGWSAADFDETFAVNVRAPFLAAQAAGRLMGEGGRIVTIGSIVADRMPFAGGALYAASKAALGGMTRAMARDLGPRGITVNLVQPGPIDTERNPADGPHAVETRAPLAIARHGRGEEVAALVAYLVSDLAGFVTGATYNIDGGWSA